MTERSSVTGFDPHAVTARPESWLVGAFLFLFSVAITAAMPQISGAVRSAVADAAKNAPGAEAAQRPTVRLRLLAVRLVEPKAAGDDVIVPEGAFAYAALQSAPRFAASIDLARQIRARGINARAPPALSA